MPSAVIETSAFDTGLLGTGLVRFGEGPRAALACANAIHRSNPLPDRARNESIGEKPEEILLAIISSVRLIVFCDLFALLARPLYRIVRPVVPRVW
jgi:hypothetical protein